MWKYKHLFELQSQWDLVCPLSSSVNLAAAVLSLPLMLISWKEVAFSGNTRKMFVLRRAIESLSPSPSCSLASALKVTVVPTVTDCHSISLFLSHCFSFHLYPPPSLPGPLSAISKTPLKERKKKDWGTGKRRWKKRNRIRQKKGNKDRNVKIFTIIPSEFLSGNIIHSTSD